VAAAPTASTPETAEAAAAIPAPVSDLAAAPSADTAAVPATQTQPSAVLEALAQLSTEQATPISQGAPTSTPVRPAANAAETVATPQPDPSTGVAQPTEAQAPVQVVSPTATASTTTVAADTTATAKASPDITVAAEAASAAVATASETKGDSKTVESAKPASPAAAVALEGAVAVETAEAVTAAGAATTGGETGAQNTGTEAGADKGAALTTVEAPAFAEAKVETTPAAPAAPVLQAAATATSSAASAPVRGSPETVATLSAEIVKKADAKTTRFDVALTPEGLGKVDVRIEIGRDGALTASMRFDTVHAAQELRGKAHELRQALADAGFNVADNALSFDVSSQGGQSQNPFFAFEGWGDQGQRAFPGRAFQAALTGEEDITITPELLPGLKTVADSGLDIRI
jgi:flagellar hook-length control protein FliK